MINNNSSQEGVSHDRPTKECEASICQVRRVLVNPDSPVLSYRPEKGTD